MSRLAAFVTPARSLADASALAAHAETLGYELVMDNHIANRDGLVTMVPFGQATSTVKLGTGIYPMLQMTPLALGQMAVSIDELIGGRLVLGLGTSHRPVIESWHGMDFPTSPLTAMRDCLTILRQLFTTGRTDHAGEHFSSQGFQFRGITPRADTQIVIAALGPKMLQLAGELADGVVLWLCNPQYVSEVVKPNLAIGAARVGRDPRELEIIAAVSCALTDDPGPAYAALKQQLIVYLSLPFYRAMLVGSGFAADLERFDAGMAAGDIPAALDGISTAMIDTLAGIGDAEHIRATLEGYRAAGVTLPGVGPIVAEGTASAGDVLAAAIAGA